MDTKVLIIFAAPLLLLSCSNNNDIIDTDIQDQKYVSYNAILPEEHTTRLSYDEGEGLFKVYWKGSTQEYQEYIKVVGITGDGTVASSFAYRSETETEDSKIATFGSHMYDFWKQQAYYGFYISTETDGDRTTEWADLSRQDGHLENLYGYHFMTGDITDNIYNDTRTVLFHHDVCIFKLSSLSIEDNLSGELTNIRFSSPQLSVYKSRYTYLQHDVDYYEELEFTENIGHPNDKDYTQIWGKFNVIDGHVQEDMYVVCFPAAMEEFTISAELNGNNYSYTYGKPLTTLAGKFYRLSNKTLTK